MQQEQNQEFLVEVQKLMTSEISSTIWASNMDLFALTTFDNLIQLYRISYKAQRVFQSDEGKAIKSMSFSPDSQLLAYGMNDGVIKIIKTQNGQQVVIVDSVHTLELESLTFVNYLTLDSYNFLPFQKNSIQSKLILNICPHKNCNRNAIIKINYFSEIKKDFTLLLSSQGQKTLLLLNGFIPLAEINYSTLSLNNPKTIYSHYDGKIRSIVSQSLGQQSIIWLLEYDTEILNKNNEHLIKLNCLLNYITEIILFIDVAYGQAEIIVRDILRQYNSKINLIDDSSSQNINPCEELFKFLNCGQTSTAIVNFFTKEVYDTKILQKLDETLNTGFAQLHDILLESIQNSLQKATVLLKNLQNLAQTPKIRNLCFFGDKLKIMEQKIINLYTMGEILLVESTEAKFDIRNLLVWLNKSTIKSSGQNQVQIENTKSYLNKYTVDFNRLYSFLSQQKKFKLQNLLNFYSKANESHPMKLQQPEFRLLSASNKIVQSPEQRQNLKTLLKLFDVEDIPSAQVESMEVEESFRNFKIQIKQLHADLKQAISQPLQSVSSVLGDNVIATKLGVITNNEMFAFQIKPIVKKGQLYIYFTQRQEGFDRLVEYNCHKRQRRSLVSTDSHILSIAVAEGIILVIENKLTQQKMVIQVANDELNGGQIQIGRRISRCQGQLDINSSPKGLNSLVIDKNKLIIFD